MHDVAWWHQAITWANVDPVLCRYMASLGHNELSTCVISVMSNGTKYKYIYMFPKINSVQGLSENENIVTNFFKVKYIRNCKS